VFLLAAEGAHGVASEDVAWIGVLLYHQCKVDHWSFPLQLCAMGWWAYNIGRLDVRYTCSGRGGVVFRA
jgi:hypothetical protein